MKFEYPVDGVGNPNDKLGCTNMVGTYPLGRLFNWHGGIHMAENSSSPIKAIADGIVIAYHIPETALQVGDNKYSNGFVLLQHKYESPKGRELVFYSLYSGLLPFDEMKSNKRYPNFFYSKSTTVQGTEVKNGKTGENLRKKSKKETITRLVENGSKVVVGDRFQAKYYEILKIDGKPISDAIMWADSLPNLVEGVDAETDRIVSGNDFGTILLVKAGQELGFAGPCGFKNHESYKTAHIEVFTDSDPSEFLKGIEGDKDDVKDTKTFLKFAKGSKLSLKYPIKFCNGDDIKVLEFPAGETEEYCRIQLDKQIRTVLWDDLKYTKGSEKREDNKVIAAKYTPGNLENLNAVFNDTLQSTSELEWVKSLAGEEKKREVSFCPPANAHIYWVKKTDLGISDKPEAVIRLSADLSDLYKNKPVDNTESELGEDYLVKNSDVKKIKQAGSDTFFYHVKTMTPVKDDKGFFRNKEVEGFIQSDDANISEVSAHNWEAFGFNVVNDQEDEFIFNNTVDKLTEENAPAFIKTVWDQINIDENKILTNSELASGLHDEFVVKKLSKMICYHTSEWGLDYNSLQSEIEGLLDEGINKEENEAKKDELNQKKQLTLSNTQQKVADLQFWSEVQVPIPDSLLGIPSDMIYDPIRNQSRKRYPWEIGFEYEQEEEDEEEYTPFPISPKVYHFHPVAFVEQMRRMNQGPKFPITVGQLGLIFPNSTEKRRKEVENAINKYSNDFNIDNINRMSHFLGQIGTETGELMQLKENYNYSAETIYNIFLKKVLVQHPDNSDKYTFKYHDLIEGYSATLVCEYPNSTISSQKNYGHKRDVENPIEVPKIGKNASWSYADFSKKYSIKSQYVKSKSLFDYVYGCRMGNGKKSTNDGSDYFGVGFIHLTGKEKYKTLNNKWNSLYPSNKKDFMGDDISLLKTDVDIAMKASMIIWKYVQRKTNNKADKGNIDSAITAVTKDVNGGTNGLESRKKYTKKAYEVFNAK